MKKIVRLTEGDLRRIIRNSVKKNNKGKQIKYKKEK